MAFLNYPKPPMRLRRKAGPMRRKANSKRYTMDTRIVKSKEFDGGWVILDADTMSVSKLSIKHNTENGTAVTEIRLFEDEFKTLLKALNEVYRESVKERKARRLRAAIEDEDENEMIEEMYPYANAHYGGNPNFNRAKHKQMKLRIQEMLTLQEQVLKAKRKKK